jgi:hypothetical protein
MPASFGLIHLLLDMPPGFSGRLFSAGGSNAGKQQR